MGQTFQARRCAPGPVGQSGPVTLKGGDTALKRLIKISLILAVFIAVHPSCSSAPRRPADPTARVAEARKLIKKRQYESATKILEEIRYATADTDVGGEVLFLLGRARYALGKYEEADSHFSAYLSGYPDGPFGEEASYLRATGNLKQIQRTSFGFFRFRKFIPSDRDVAALRRTRALYLQHLEKFPESPRAEEAARLADTLLEKEGEHQLQVAAFYLKKGHYEAVLKRTERIASDEYPETVTTRARELAEKARAELEAPVQ